MNIKKALKSVLQVAALTAVVPLAVLDLVLRPLDTDGVFTGISQLLSLVPGKTGSYLRAAYYRLAMESCTQDCFIGFGTLFFQRDTTLGVGVYIGPQCNIGSSEIGRDTLIASGVHVMSGSAQHRFSDLDAPIREQGGEYRRVKVGDDCWIGNGALVMADIGNKCVIGAGSVVTHPIPAFSIAAGNPARVLRSRQAEPAADAAPDSKTA